VAGDCEYGNKMSVCGDWMELAQNRYRWLALVSTEMNCRFVGTRWSCLRIGIDGGHL
jgi:hypothetical protein